MTSYERNLTQRSSTGTGITLFAAYLAAFVCSPTCARASVVEAPPPPPPQPGPTNDSPPPPSTLPNPAPQPSAGPAYPADEAATTPVAPPPQYSNAANPTAGPPDPAMSGPAPERPQASPAEQSSTKEGMSPGKKLMIAGGAVGGLGLILGLSAISPARRSANLRKGIEDGESFQPQEDLDEGNKADTQAIALGSVGAAFFGAGLALIFAGIDRNKDEFKVAARAGGLEVQF